MTARHRLKQQHMLRNFLSVLWINLPQ